MKGRFYVRTCTQISGHYQKKVKIVLLVDDSPSLSSLRHVRK